MWAASRKILYGLGTILIVVGVSVFLLRERLFPTPTCFDGKKNGFEIGIDCSGACMKKCQGDTVPVGIVWSKAFSVAPGVYDIVLLLVNKNIDTAPYRLHYSVKVFDVSGAEINTFSGVSVAPLGGEFPLVFPNVVLPSDPSKITATLQEDVSYVVGKDTVNPFTVVTDFDTSTMSHVYAQLTNNSDRTFLRFPVRMIAYNDTQEPIATGETFVDIASPKTTQKIVFTWNTPFDVPPALIRIHPILDPFTAR